MSPVRAPSPFKTSTDPDDALLLAASTMSLDLESSEIRPHEKAMSTPPLYSSNPNIRRVERIPVKNEDLYPTESNGGNATMQVKACVARVRKSVKSVMEVVRRSRTVPSTPMPAAEEENLIVLAAAVKARMFDEALAALPSLTAPVYIKATLEEDLGELEARLRALNIPEDCDGWDGEEEIPDEEFIFVNICNNLAGSGEGYIAMFTGPVPDTDDSQGEALLHCGSGFQ